MSFYGGYFRFLFKTLPTAATVTIAAAATTTLSRFSFTTFAQSSSQSNDIYQNVSNSQIPKNSYSQQDGKGHGPVHVQGPLETNEGESSKSIPIVNLSTYKLDSKALNSVLSKVGESKFAIISVNGPKREGKSFLLSYFLHFLRLSPAERSSSWVTGASVKNDGAFEWRRGDKSCTTGIQIWNEPLKVTKSDGTTIYVLLLDCEGSFDMRSSTAQNTILFTISTLLSSVSIFNVMRQLEDKMFFLELFSDFAAAVKAKLAIHHHQQPNSDNNSKNTEHNLFQKLIILVRDHMSPEDYPHGHYTDSDQPLNAKSNFKTDKINPANNQSIEVQKNRKRIVTSFEYISAYLLPSPGLRLQEEDKTDFLNPAFSNHLEQFIQSTLNPDLIETKKINGKEVTGNEFMIYVDAYGKLDWSKDSPYIIQNLCDLTREAHCYHAKDECIKIYKKQMENNLEDGYLVIEKLEEVHSVCKQEALEVFRKKTIGFTADGLETDLNQDIEDEYVRFRYTNRVRQPSIEALVADWIKVIKNSVEDLDIRKPSTIIIVGTAILTQVWGLLIVIPAMYYKEIERLMVKTKDYAYDSAIALKKYIEQKIPGWKK